MAHWNLLRKTALATLLFFFTPHLAQPCTRVYWSENGQYIVVGRTMDWGDNTVPDFWVFPRGLFRTGRAGSHSHTWHAKYGSLVISAYGKVTVDGLNEPGLAGHVLYFKEAEYGSPKAGNKLIASGMWLQYILDSYASVEEAVQDAPNLSIILDHVNGHNLTIHIALEDINGDSAVLEFINQKLEIYQHKRYNILTNSPSYKTQLHQASQCRVNKETVYSASMKSKDRFCLSSLFLERLSKPSNPKQAATIMMSLMRTLSVPFSLTNSTFYRTVIDITHGHYYFDNAEGLNLFHVNFKAFDFRPEAKIKHLNPLLSHLQGEVSQQFRNWEKAPF